MIDHPTPIPKRSKTLRPSALLAVAGALLVPASLAHAQQSLRVDTGGHPTAPLDLGDLRVTGTLDAARLPSDVAFHTLNVSDRTLFAGPLSLPANQPITLADNDISGSILTIGVGGIFTPQTLPAGHSIRRNAANTAFEDYAPNSGDGSALLNLNASALGSGTVPPARLGTGTPSSATVLRGDGTWAGTTAGGNTVAATSDLLAGDGAGNAAGVSDDADLYRVLRARADTQGNTLAVPQNLLPSLTLNLHASTQNADGSITIAANSYVEWDDNQGVTVAPRYACVVATTGAAAGTLVAAGYYGGNQAVDQGNVQTRPLPGVVTTTFTNHVGAGAYQFCVTNGGASPVTIYYPSLSLVDPGHPVFSSAADATAVPVQPVADLDFTKFASADRSSRYLDERQITFAADSVNGDGGNAGTLYAPTNTLPATIPNPGAVVGLYRGSLFRASLPLPTLSTTHGVVVQDAALGSLKPLPIVSALDPAASGSFTANGDGTYSYLWTPADSTISNAVNGGYRYSNVYVVEINTATEATLPVASRRRMTDVLSPTADGTVAAFTPGSVWVQPPGTGSGQSGSATQWKAVLQPSDGKAPGSGAYRYEVVSRVQPANWGSGDANPGDGAMSGLQLVGGSSGYGSLGGPPGFAGDRLAILHATTHGAVIGGGSLQRSVFYEAGDPSCILLAWYTGHPAGLRWDTRHCLFYANVGDRPAYGLIAHSSSGNYDRGDISDTAFLGARWSDGSLHGIAMDYVNVNAGVIDRVYVQATYDAFGLSMPLAAEVRHSVFRQVYQARVGVNFHDNIVLAETAGVPGSPANAPTACLFQQSGASATNNLFWARSVPGLTAGNGDQASGVNFYNNNLTNCTFARNIVVLNPANPTVAATYLNFGSASLTGQHIDYNLVINLAKAGFGANNPTPPPNNFTSWAAYQAGQTLYDQHSLYVDLSGDPRGVQAVFVDPLNGDFRWAQTDVARRCAAYCRANNVGPATVTTRWPVVPTVDDAVRLLTDL